MAAEKLDTVSFFLPGAVTEADNLIELKLPTGRGFTLTGVSVCAQTFPGGTTQVDIDVSDDGTAVASAVGAQTVAGTPVYTAIDYATYPTRHIAGGSIINIDLNCTTSTQATNTAIVLYGLWDG